MSALRGLSSASGTVTSARWSATSPVGLVELAVGEVLREEAAADALPAILELLNALFGCRAAIAFSEDARGELVVLAAYPAEAGTDQALYAEIRAHSARHRDAAATGGYFLDTLASGGGQAGQPPGLMMAYSAPDAGRRRCAVALVGDSARWDADSQATTRTLAAIVAVQIRHAEGATALAGRQARDSALIEGSPDAIVVADASRRVVLFNAAAEALTGWQRDEVIGKDLAEALIPESERFAAMDAIENYLASGDLAGFNRRLRVPIRRADRTERMIEVTPVPIRIDGQVHFCGFLRDTSELERAHAALLESDSRMRLLSQLAPVGIMQTDLKGVCTFANDRWCEMTGVTQAEAVGSDWTAGVHPADIERLVLGWGRAAASSGELRTDCRLLPVAGREVWVHLAVVPIRAAGGSPLGFLAALTNISDRKRAEAETERLLIAEREARRDLADQTQRLNGLISAANSGIVFDDEHGLITQVNQSFCDLFGLTGGPGQLIGARTARVALRISGAFADPAGFLRAARSRLAARLPVTAEDIACADGRTLEWDYVPVFVDGEYRGSLWGVGDVTDRQLEAAQRERLLEAELAARQAAERAQIRLAEQNAHLQALDEEKTQFLATMSHELRTPLTSIVSFTELILDDEQHELTPDTVSSLTVIQRNAERLLRLVGDLLLLNRLEAGAVPLDIAPVSVPELVGEVVRSGSATAAAGGIVLEVSATDGPLIQADRLRLDQVLDNLLSNAIKFSRENGRIQVEASHDDQMWRIDVTDDGIGIPAHDLGQLFGRFVRATNARVAGLPGTGLGLSVVKAITELHGGRVAVRSVEGHGTTVSVYLPMSP
jgi:PAS domain S-box-containing protein